MAASELARHASEFLRVAQAHPQHLDSGTVKLTDEVAHLFVVIDVEMTLAFRARGRSDTGVQKHERVEIMLGRQYPWRCPVFFLRTDFPTALPHLTPGRGETLPQPCLVDGSAGEFFSHFGLLELGVLYLLDQMAIWLGRAAAGQLMDPRQGWEPLPRHDAADDLVLDTDFARSQVDRRGGWVVLKSFYHRTGPIDAQLGDEARAYLLASNTPTPLYDDPEKLSYTRRRLPGGNATGQSITAVIWPGRHAGGQLITSDTFLPETVHSLADLRARAVAMGSAAHLDAFLARFEQSLSAQKAEFPIPVGIVLCVRRPYRLMNRQSDIELIPYAFEVRPASDRSRLYPADETQLRVVPLRHLEHIGPKLLQEVSGSPSLKATSIIGCGSVGSKVAMHLARAGATIKAVADHRNLLPITWPVTGSSATARRLPKQTRSQRILGSSGSPPPSIARMWSAASCSRLIAGSLRPRARNC